MKVTHQKETYRVLFVSILLGILMYLFAKLKVEGYIAVPILGIIGLLFITDFNLKKVFFYSIGALLLSAVIYLLETFIIEITMELGLLGGIFCLLLISLRYSILKYGKVEYQKLYIIVFILMLVSLPYGLFKDKIFMIFDYELYLLSMAFFCILMIVEFILIGVIIKKQGFKESHNWNAKK